jgi:hypothetical protein
MNESLLGLSYALWENKSVLALAESFAILKP